MNNLDERKFTTVQQEAIDRITALFVIENETGTITKRARNFVMQHLDPEDLAAIATSIVKFQQSISPKQLQGNNSAVSDVTRHRE